VLEENLRHYEQAHGPVAAEAKGTTPLEGNYH
jgi:hypothetical protein